MKDLTRSDLAQFSGSVNFYRHQFNRAVIFTDGIHHVAEHGEAHWLIDDIAIHLGSDEFRQAVRKDERVRLMSFWKLAVHEDRSAELTARADSGEPAFITQTIPWTDFPLDDLDIWVAANEFAGYTLLLPGEY